MTATLVQDLYDFVRVATGNDDLDVGMEVLPDQRIAVLVKTAVMTITSYSDSFPALVFDSTVNPAMVYVRGYASDPLSDPLIIALVYAAAHRYFVGIGNRQGAAECLSAIYKAAELISGHTVVAVNETDLVSALVYKARKQQEATAQKNLR